MRGTPAIAGGFALITMSVLVCFALKEEAAPFHKIAARHPGVITLIVGIGRENAEKSVRSFLPGGARTVAVCQDLASREQLMAGPARLAGTLAPPSSFNPNSEIETGARPPRAQFSAPSRKTRAHRNVPIVRGRVTRNRLAARARPATPGAGVLPSFGVRVQCNFQKKNRRASDAVFR
jgi:hypothetical protein